MKFITLVIIMQAVLASSLDTSNNVTDNHDTEMTRSLRGMGMGGKGMGGMGHGGWGGGGRGPGGNRRETMQIIQRLFQNRDSIEREVTETDEGVIAYTHSNNKQVSEWIKKQLGRVLNTFVLVFWFDISLFSCHLSVEQMKNLMEEGSGIRMWDDLFEVAFQYHDLNEMSITELKDGVNVTHHVTRAAASKKKDCVIAVIHKHAGVVSDFITKGRSEAQSNHAVPDECQEL